MNARSILANTLFFIAALCPTALGQTTTGTSGQRAVPAITVSLTDRGVRFAALGAVTQTRLEVFGPAGEQVYTSGFLSGNVRDWSARDIQGEHLPDGTYTCVITATEAGGQVSTREGSVLISGGQLALQLGGGSVVTEPAQGSPARTEHMTAGAGGPGAMTLTAHDGTEGQVTSTTGALSFRLGDFFTGKDKEAMRLTEKGVTVEGDLRASGVVRAAGGIEFPDGTVLSSATGSNQALGSESAAGDQIVDGNLVFTNPGFPNYGRDIHLSDNLGGLRFYGAPTLTNPPNGAAIQFFGNGHTQFPGQAYIDAGAHNNAAVIFRTGPSGQIVTERMRVASSGNVGIGTSSPAEKVEVAGNVKLTGTGNGVIFPDGTKQTTAATGGSGLSAVSHDASLAGDGTSGSPLGVAPGQVVRSVNGLTDELTLTAGDGITITPSGNTLTVASVTGGGAITQSGGNVGIGTNTPAYKLDVAGNLRASRSVSNDVVVETTAPGDNAWARLWMITPVQKWSWGTSRNFNGNQLYLVDDTNQKTRMTVQPNEGAISFPFGHIGIGTTNPALLSGGTGRMLEISNSNSPGLALRNTGTGGNQFFLYSRTEGTAGSGSLRIFDATNNADRFVLANNGNVGIGNINPVNGKLEVQTSSGKGIHVTTGGGVGLHVDCAFPDCDAGFFTGNVDVGGRLDVVKSITAQNAEFSGYVTVSSSFSGGSGTFSGSVSAEEFIETSDRNAKSNFAAVNPRSVLSRLATIPIQTWNFKSQPESVRHMGPMAQDFRAAFNLGRDDKHISALDAQGVTMAAIQGLYQLMQEKEAQIAQLRARVVRLERRTKRRRN